MDNDNATRAHFLGTAGPIWGSPLMSFWLARSTEPGAGYGRCWKSGPLAVVSAARGCAPSMPDDQPPSGASE